MPEDKETRKIEKTKYYSEKIGELPKGCQSCVRGLKTVIFVTGLCSRKCYFCPTSDDKQYKDVLYANERKIETKNEEEMFAEIVEEVKRQNARGAGITGGDPLQKLDRTCFIIKKLKETYDVNFHIHLYTPLEKVNKNKLTKLYEAGLDEIRFHPDVENDKHWDRIALAREFDWKVGVEIPVDPNKIKDIENLIMFLKDGIDFLNLNELEVADNSQSKLVELGYICKDGTSYAVEDSETIAKQVMTFILEQEIDYDVHYCSAKLKDGVQLCQRILRTGKNVKKSFEKITHEGLLERGIIYLKGLSPGVGYMKKINSFKGIKRKKIIEDLNNLREKLIENHKFKKDDLIVDKRKLRIITSISNAKIAIKKNKGIKCAITTEYPTYDQIEIEVEFLK